MFRQLLPKSSFDLERDNIPMPSSVCGAQFWPGVFSAKLVLTTERFFDAIFFKKICLKNTCNVQLILYIYYMVVYVKE